MQNRDNVTQFWVEIPPGLTAKQYRDQVKLAALQSGMSTQKFMQLAVHKLIAQSLAKSK